MIIGPVLRYCFVISRFKTCFRISSTSTFTLSRITLNILFLHCEMHNIFFRIFTWTQRRYSIHHNFLFIFHSFNFFFCNIPQDKIRQKIECNQCLTDCWNEKDLHWITGLRESTRKVSKFASKMNIETAFKLPVQYFTENFQYL